MIRKIYLVIAGLFLLTLQLKAQSPASINYQGVARNISGFTLENSPIGLRITIHEGSASGTVVYQETQFPTTSQFGLFNIAIGTGTVISGNFSTITWGRGGVYYLQIEMDPTGGHNFADMGNSQMLSVPYSLFADTSFYSYTATNSQFSDTASYARNAGKSVWNVSGTAIYNSNTGPVGVGTATPTDSTSLDVASTHKYGGRFVTDSLSDNASAVSATYTGTGNYNASGVSGVSVPADGYGIGGNFTGGATGVQGSSYGATAGDYYIGAVGSAGSSVIANTYGTYGIATNTGGTTYGAFGFAIDNNAGTTYGVYGDAFSGGGTGYGVYGYGNTVGTYGTAIGSGATFPELGSPYGSELRTVGVYGEVTGTIENTSVYEDDGVLGVANMTGNYHTAGVCGYGTNATGTDIGVFGMGQGLGTENYVIGVYGYEDPAQGGGGVGSYVADYAGYFIGNVDITGTLTAATKNFKIDDPLDPANKYLYHSCVESPDMMNIYNGNIVTDANGDATVTLPQYFEAANTDFKYQLTVIGQFAQAIIATEISNNQFTIKTDKPNVKVSWQVTGVRNDPYAKNNPTVAEVDKQGVEKGHYIHPEYYGQPQTLSIANLISGDMTNPQNLAAYKARATAPPPQPHFLNKAAIGTTVVPATPVLTK